MNIKLHSIVDIITNSSSEIFTNAKSNSAEEVKKIINAIIALCGGTGTADDLFEIKVIVEEMDGDEYDINSKEGKSIVTGEGYYDINVKVTPKDGNNKYAAEAANLLSQLKNLFESEERSC